jgi:hypothetical protein
MTGEMIMLSTNEQEGDMAMDNALTMQELGEAELLSVGGGFLPLIIAAAAVVLTVQCNAEVKF